MLGCLYLANSLFLAALFNKDHLKILSFLFNPANRKLLLGWECPYIILCCLALLETGHWLLLLMLSMHLYNSGILLLKPRIFYQEIDNIDKERAPFIMNMMMLMLTIAGTLCIYVSVL